MAYVIKNLNNKTYLAERDNCYIWTKLLDKAKISSKSECQKDVEWLFDYRAVRKNANLQIIEVKVTVV